VLREQSGPDPRAISNKDTVRVDDTACTDETDAVARSIGHLLLVEDSMIIALDAEDVLCQLGVERVSVACTVKAAFRVIDGDPPQLALLDYNLGDESSETIAHWLTQLQIPFWFVTGYGDAIGDMTSTRARGVLRKPYSRDDLAAVLDQFRNGAAG